MKKLCIFLLLLFAATGILFAQEIEKSVKERLSNYFETYTPASANTGSCKLKSVDIDFEGRKLSIYASESFAYQPFVPETVDEIYHQIEELLPGPVRFFRTTIYANNQPIEELIPNFFRGKKKKDKSRLSNAEYKGAPWVINTSRPYEITKGLQNRHISLWQSHGKYYKNDKGEWVLINGNQTCLMGMATSTLVLHYRGPVHAIFHSALCHPYARKRRS